MPHPQGVRKEHGKEFPGPACYSEAAKVAKELFPRIKAIKKVLEVAGLAPAHFDENWAIPFTEGEVCEMITVLMMDVQSIENLLIQSGLANEKELTPLTPRWRIDPVKHHNRNWQIFQRHVRELIHLYDLGVEKSETIQEHAEKIKKLDIHV